MQSAGGISTAGPDPAYSATCRAPAGGWRVGPAVATVIAVGRRPSTKTNIKIIATPGQGRVVLSPPPPPQAGDAVPEFEVSIDGVKLPADHSFPVKDKYEITGKFRGKPTGLDTPVIVSFAVLRNGTEVTVQSGALTTKQSGPYCEFSATMGRLTRPFDLQVRITSVDGKLLGARPASFK